MNRFVLSTLLGILTLQTTPSPAQNATITGSVVKAATGEPLPGAQLLLTRVSAPNAGLIPAAKSDEQGNFVFMDIPAGSYRITATRNGYSQQQYGQRFTGRAGTVVTVGAGQQLKDIAFRMNAAGTISGRVTDVKGEPLPGVSVQALRSTYDVSGRRSLQPAGSAKTNDLGEYRLYWINPGRYYVTANATPTGMEAILSLSPEETQQVAQVQSIFGPGKNPNEVAELGYAVTYFPGTREASGATPVDVQSGGENRGIDFTLSPDRKVHIRGRVVESGTGRPPQSAQFTMSPKGTTGAAYDSFDGLDAFRNGNSYNAATGEYEIKDVSEGSYWLQVMTQNPNTTGAPDILSFLNATQVPIDVAASDIDNLTIVVSPGIAISGRVRMEGQNQNVFGNIGISLNSLSGGPASMSMLGGTTSHLAIDGTFLLPRIVPGDYKLSVTGLGPTMYVKEARLEQVDIFGGVTIADRVNGLLEVTISSNGGEVDGTIMDAASKPAANVGVVLIPDRQRDRHELYKTATTDSNGQAVLRGLTPGDYRLFAWEDIEPFSWFDPDVLKQYEIQGKAIHVKEMSREQIEMKLIPAQ
jgi:5-hydroxyisourate hydrolase-like protein (transthyretin family)